MNVLALLQQAAGQIGVPEPSTYTANNKLLRCLYAVLRELRSSRAFPQQKRTHTITLTAARDKYPLPADFFSGLISTQYDRTSNWALVGPLSDSQWNFRLYDLGSSGYRFGYRVFGPDFNQGSATAGGQLHLDPAPSSADVIGFDYIMATTILPTPWTASTAVSLNEQRHANGNIYQATVAGTTGTTPPSHTDSTPVADGTATWAYVSEAKETIGASTDRCIFDDEIVIQGLVAHWNKSHKFPIWEAEYRLFRNAIDAAVMRWTGPTRGTLVRGPVRGRYRVPAGGWSF